MAYENETLGALLSDPRIAPIAAEAIRNRDESVTGAPDSKSETPKEWV